MAKAENDHLAAVRAYLERAGLDASAVDDSAGKPRTPSGAYEFDTATSSPAAQTDDNVPLSAEELLGECRLEPETDIGNARRLMIRHGDRILSVARVAWHGFDGRRWKEDEDGSIVRPLAQATAERIVEEAYALDASDQEKAALAAGEVARVDLKALGKPDAKWDADTTRRAEALTVQVERMEKAKKAISDRMSSRFRHAKSSAGTSRINNMLIEASPHCARMVGDLNRDRLALNCRNGTLRFARIEDEESDPDDPRFVWTARLDRHRQADYITKLVPFPAPPSSFGSAARAATPADRSEDLAPQFDKFLKTILPDAEIRAFLKRFFGYCLTGLTVEQCLVFFYGVGRNGKSTLLDLLVEVFGDYAVTLSIDSFAGESRRGGAEATPDLARLPGARLVSASEPEMGVKLKDALIKALTGGEKIPVRRLHQDFIEVDPQFKIILSGNHKPRIDDTSDGIWRRVHLVPFDIQIPREMVDRALPRKLRAEAEGVFAWLIEGALDYLNHGLAPPAKVMAATQDYREESDPIGTFIRSACVVTGKEEDAASPGDLFVGYSNWAGREGAAEFRQNTFSRRFPDYARKTWEGSDGKMHQFWKAKAGTTVYRGIRVKDAFVAPKGDGSYAEQRG